MPYDTRTKVLTKSEAAAAQARFDEKWSAFVSAEEASGINRGVEYYYRQHAAMWAGEFGAEQVTVVNDPPAQGNEVTHVGH